MQGLNGGRVNIGTSTLLHTWYLTSDVTWVTCFSRVASCSLGGAQASLEAAIEHMDIRKQFQTKLKDFQVSQIHLYYIVGLTFAICSYYNFCSTCNFESPKCRRLSSRHDFSFDKQQFLFKNLEKTESLSAPWPNSSPPNTALTSEPQPEQPTLSSQYHFELSLNSRLILGLQLSSSDLRRLWLLKRLPCSAVLAWLASTPNTRRFVTSRLAHTEH